MIVVCGRSSADLHKHRRRVRRPVGVRNHLTEESRVVANEIEIRIAVVGFINPRRAENKEIKARGVWVIEILRP